MDEADRPAANRSGRQSLAERFQRAKMALAKADPFYASEGFWKGFESGPVDEAQVAKVEEMVRSYQRQGPNSRNRKPPVRLTR